MTKLFTRFLATAAALMAATFTLNAQATSYAELSHAKQAAAVTNYQVIVIADKIIAANNVLPSMISSEEAGYRFTLKDVRCACEDRVKIQPKAQKTNLTAKAAVVKTSKA